MSNVRRLRLISTIVVSFYVDFKIFDRMFIVDHFVIRRIFMKDTKVDAGDDKKLFVSRIERLTNIDRRRDDSVFSSRRIMVEFWH